MIRAIVVDDERPARDRLCAMLEGMEEIEVVAEAEDGDDAVVKIEQHRPDLVFLDIQMPGRSGMEVAASLSPPRPRIIFCTAFDRYAIEAFEHAAVDYLLKPLNRDRLVLAVERLHRSIDDHERHRREVADASATQARLLPQGTPSIRGLELRGESRAARGVGGDYYDFLSAGEDRIGIALGDVSGKGLFAGLLMAGLQARVQSLASRHGAAVSGLAEELNAALHDTTDSNRYATLFYGVYEESSRRLTWFNAGHTPPLMYRRATGRFMRLAATGTAIGLLPGAGYRSDSLEMVGGDILLAFSDGLPETTATDDEEFGEARLREIVVGNAGLSAGRLLERILSEVDAFRGDAPLRDDLTVVVAEVSEL
jgi:sigma-B regulation protein RsbU (phosphoserine phosphatase)